MKNTKNAFEKKTKCTHVTLVASHVSPAGGAIAAGLVLAVVHLLVAVAPGVVGGALAIVAVPHVDAVAAVEAEILCWDPW